MFIFYNNSYVIDPNMLGITVLRKIWDRDKHPKKLVAKAQLKWLYYTYHPLSTFREYKNSEKTEAIKKYCFDTDAANAWDIEVDEEMKQAVEFYRQHIARNALWYTYESYKEGMYNLGQIVRNPESSANDISKARQELDAIPKSLKKMKIEAEREDQIIENKIVGDKDIKRGEKLPLNAQR